MGASQAKDYGICLSEALLLACPRGRMFEAVYGNHGPGLLHVRCQQMTMALSGLLVCWSVLLSVSVSSPRLLGFCHKRGHSLLVPD